MRRWVGAVTLPILIAMTCLATAQWARAQMVHEWFQWLSPRPGPPGRGTHPIHAYSRLIELDGTGIAYVSFSCEMRTSEAMGFTYRRAHPSNVAWRELDLGARRLWFGCQLSYPTYIAIPYWAICAGGMAGLMTLRVLQRRNARKTEQKLCPVCGYDLRATPTRCPECGTPVAESADSASPDERAIAG
jgi:hypothetical protein